MVVLKSNVQNNDAMWTAVQVCVAAAAAAAAGAGVAGGVAGVAAGVAGSVVEGGGAVEEVEINLGSMFCGAA